MISNTRLIGFIRQSMVSLIIMETLKCNSTVNMYFLHMKLINKAITIKKYVRKCYII